MSTGRQKPITFAARTRLEAVEHLAPRFFAEVVHRDYRDFIITDESDLYDVLNEAEIENALDRMERHYLLDPRIRGTTGIVALLEFLDEHGVSH